MPQRIQQRSRGDGSPNIVIIEANKKQSEVELKTIMNLIVFISNQAEKEVEFDLFSAERVKDIEKKINIRFSLYSKKLKSEYFQLLQLYQEKYNLAKKQIGIDKIQSEQIAIYLGYFSDRFLEKSKNNPIEALDNLTKHFHKALQTDSQEEYAFNAIRYFLFQELVNCNIFPNPNDL